MVSAERDDHASLGRLAGMRLCRTRAVARGASLGRASRTCSLALRRPKMTGGAGWDGMGWDGMGWDQMGSAILEGRFCSKVRYYAARKAERADITSSLEEWPAVKSGGWLSKGGG